MSDSATQEISRRRAWAIFALGALFFCYGFFQRVSPSVMVEELMREFAVGGAVLGNLSAFYFYAYASLQIPVGLLLDRYGPRRLMTAAATLCAAGSLVFALAPNLGVAYGGRLMIGVGAGFTWVGALTLITLFFPAQRFAMLVGMAQFIGMMGAVFGQAPLQAAVAAFGWRGTLSFAAAIGLVIALALWLVVRDRPRSAAARAAGSSGLLIGLRQVIANPQTWACAILGGSMTAPTLAFAGLWGVPFLVQCFDVPRTEAAFAASMGFIGFGVGATVLGLISDRLRRRKPILIFGSATLIVALIGMFYFTELGLLAFIGFNILHGIGGGCMVVAFATAREHNPVNATGAAYGFVNTFVVASGAIFQPLVGALLDLRWDGQMLDGARLYSLEAYRFALSSLPIMAGIGFLASLLVRETNCRQQVA